MVVVVPLCRFAELPEFDCLTVLLFLSGFPGTHARK